MKMSETKHLTRSENETFELGKKLGKDFKGKEIVLLTGPLGAGKTIFTKGLCAGMGLEDVSSVCSPSYTLINEYNAKFPIFHMDFYRLNGQDEIESLGWEDYSGEGVLIIEWGERLKLESGCIKIVIKILGENERKITWRIYQNS